GAATTSGSEDVLENKSAGVFVQEQLGINNRLFLTGALRADDNSAFGANFKFVTYPKLSASWVVNEEPFWKRNGALSTLKLRAAWGQAGQQPDAFAAQQSYAPTSGNAGVPTLTPQNLGNPDLKPERGEELEVGLDAGLFHDESTLSFTYYNNYTKDAIVPRTIKPSLGYPGTQLVNLGEVRNWGYEVQLDSRLFESQRFAGTLGFGFSYNNNRVLDLGGVPLVQYARGTAIPQVQQDRVGYPIGSYFRVLLVSAQLDAKKNPINLLCKGSQSSNYQ